MVTTDVVALRFLPSATVQLLLTVRAREPYTGQHALPGVYVNAGEALSVAARRALHTKAGVVDSDIGLLRQVLTFDGPSRDPRGPALSVAHVAVVSQGEPNGGESPTWWPLAGRPSLAFDHDAIVVEALRWLSERVWADRSVLAGFFPAGSATGPELAALVGALSGAQPDRRNFHRRLATCEFLQPVAERTVQPRTRGRMPTMWVFTAV